MASLYDAPALAGNRLCLAISQSCKSPDLLAAVEQQRDACAFVVALVNAEGSPLAGLAVVVIPLSAGAERSVAATKSYIASLAAIAEIGSANVRTPVTNAHIVCRLLREQ